MKSFFSVVLLINAEVSWLYPTGPQSGFDQHTGAQRPLTYVDMSHPLDENTPTFYPTGQKVKLQVHFQANLGPISFLVHNFSMTEHIGTHMDIPAHCRPANASHLALDTYPVRNYINKPAVVINIRDRASTDPDASVNIGDLLQWESRNGRIPDGAMVFMNSGWSQFFNDSNRYVHRDSDFVLHCPGFSPEAAEWLTTHRNITGIGSDAISLDVGRSSTWDVHRIILVDNELLGLENVANVDKIPEVGATASFLPMNIRGGTGAPTRIIAWY